MVKMSLGETSVKFAHEEITELEVVTKNEIGEISKYSVDENGVAKPIEFDFTGAFDDITSIGNYGLYYAFYYCPELTGPISFPNLTSISDYGLSKAFYDCTGLTGPISFPALTTIGTNGLYYTFYYCKEITGSINFPNLTSIGNYGLSNAFNYCIGLTGSISFPNLTTISSSGLYYAFQYCTKITALHFRADMQATIEALTSYPGKFGATNATIYFDL